MQNEQCLIAVLISGGGSNLQSIIDHVRQDNINAKIACVISNVSSAYGLERAKQVGIPTHVISHTNYASREAFDEELVNTLKVYNIKLVVLAGFMRILSNTFIEQHYGNIFNIHPSLLPKYPGLHTHQCALDAGDTEHGCSVHYATDELDAGPLIIQAKVPIMKTDDADSLAKRVLKKEHIIYPLAVKWFCEDKLAFKDGFVYFENELLEKPIELTREHELELQ